MGTLVQSRASRRPPAAGRLLLVAAILAAGLGLGADAQAAVKASVQRGALTVTGTGAGERIALRAGARGRLVVDVRDNGTADFSFLRKRFTRIVVNAGAGNDRLRIDERRGRFTNTERTTLSGGAGLDTLLGGSFAEVLSGGAGNDTVDGNGGADRTLLGAGDDRVIWNAGDGADQVQGDAGADAVTVNGTVGSDTIAVTAAAAGHVRVSGGPDLVRVERLIVNGLTGNDTLSGGVLAGLIQLTLDGGAGGDVLNGGNGNDTLNGGTENDTVDGNQGSDSALLGDGNDAFVWDAGDGVDQVQGDAGADAVRINGTTGPDTISVAPGAVAGHVVVSGGPDVVGAENLIVSGLGGDDTLSGGALAGLILLALDGGAGNDVLSGGNGNDGLVGGTENDAVAGNAGVDAALLGDGNDAFTWNAGDGADQIDGELGTDAVTINSTSGADTIDVAPTAVAGHIGVSGGPDLTGAENLVLNGLAGDDTLTGGAPRGADPADARRRRRQRHPQRRQRQRRSERRDRERHGRRQRRAPTPASLGAGNDTFVWDPGDGSDVVEGGADPDTLRFNGSAGAEIFAASANGGRMLFTRNLGNIVMDTDDVETLDAQRARRRRHGDGQRPRRDRRHHGQHRPRGQRCRRRGADVVTVNGTAAADVIQAAAVGATVQVTGLAAQVNITSPEAANDRLTVNGLGGNDTLSGGAPSPR